MARGGSPEEGGRSGHRKAAFPPRIPVQLGPPGRDTCPSFGFVYANKVRDKLLFCLNFVAAWSLGLLQLPLLLFQHYNFSSLSHNSSLFVRAL